MHSSRIGKIKLDKANRNKGTRLEAGVRLFLFGSCKEHASVVEPNTKI